jgi:hypothetical protein
MLAAKIECAEIRRTAIAFPGVPIILAAKRLRHERAIHP